jgi:hypothetical protein
MLVWSNLTLSSLLLDFKDYIQEGREKGSLQGGKSKYWCWIIEDEGVVFTLRLQGLSNRKKR